MIKAMYHAKIFEYEDGTTRILYKCDKELNKECKKTYCNHKICTHTYDKKYAKNFLEVDKILDSVEQ